ncbi:hypothetical protein T440DRAFT_399071 [Plenodomus tracheiphilus IPT5]|uniref:Zn(2)-C6 fungal-type domain-containing protein n=1 Tax=Plenodomus tracheiphilus IPT5 TaxID=1408161 RepID=A0A6A7B4C5_9PLEO|nr:hypothetical protein T440DRAFT_399071 [Plenodomus tracheiphilus IPT5]
MPSTGPSKPRKPRPSRARGLRTTTGCLTCRKRRVKCDEGKPTCATCGKSERECVYATDSALDPTAQKSGSIDPSTPSVQEDDPGASQSPALSRRVLVAGDIDPRLCTNSPRPSFKSPERNAPWFPSPTSAPLEWYDLLAEDAINNMDKYNLDLELERTTLSSRHSPNLEALYDEAQPQALPQERESSPVLLEQWNSSDNIPMTSDELMLLHHYTNMIGPMIDLCDPSKQFTTAVPRLAVRNVGLLKSLLAVSARHMALGEPRVHVMQSSMPYPASDSNIAVNPMHQVATHYYYETLQYLSQNLLYPSYSQSKEIISTALLISTYEMFDAEGLYSNGAWERHLRGIFWIQRSQNNNGECKDPLRRAAWWQWLRQDTWAAFREGRKVLTFWEPTKHLVELSPDELCLRIIYISAKCVDFAASEKHDEIAARIAEGNRLLRALEDWNKALPSSFEPLYKAVLPLAGQLFAPIWIHPASYASAIQHFHFSRIVVIINQPSIGGATDFSERQLLLNESVDTICGMAVMHQSMGTPSMTPDFQALYAAGLCTQSPVKQTFILRLLENTADISRFSPKTLLESLMNYWRAGS